MKLIVLGSGTTVPSIRRSAPAYYVETTGGQFLVDCGSGALVQLARARKSYKTLDAVFVTHTHPDHVGDLIRLIHALQATPRFKRSKPLSLFGPAGFREFFDKCIVPVVARPKDFDVEVVEIVEDFDFAGVRVSSAPTVHVPGLNSLAYRFQEDQKRMVFSGDCDYDPAIVELCKDADLLVLDCSFTDEFKVVGHLSASECGRVAKKAGAKRLLLSHLYPLEHGHDKRLEECRSVFKGDTDLAEDLLQVEL